MTKGHTPFGYRIQNGIAVVCKEEVRQIKQIYKGYLSGMSYMNAAEHVGLHLNHCCVKRLLQNRHYLGDEFYPAIIDRKMFDAAERERRRRSTLLGRDHRKKTFSDKIIIPKEFTMGKAQKRIAEPFAQAEYLYSLIEVREV
jgi:hypothetical protein